MGQREQKANGDQRRRLSRDGVLRAGVELADDSGIDSVSMRNLAGRLDVVPMALYNHVANKKELLDGMIDVIVGEIDPTHADGPWKSVVRARVLSARQVMLRHPWARQVMESRTTRTPRVLAHMDSMARTFRAAGFSVELTHHIMHALGRRMWGLSHDLFPDPEHLDAAAPGPTASELAETHPHIAEIATAYDLGRACDAQAEFEFTLDLLLDGFERLRRQDWTSSSPRRASARTIRVRTAARGRETDAPPPESASD